MLREVSINYRYSDLPRRAKDWPSSSFDHGLRSFMSVISTKTASFTAPYRRLTWYRTPLHTCGVFTSSTIFSTTTLYPLVPGLDSVCTLPTHSLLQLILQLCDLPDFYLLHERRFATVLDAYQSLDANLRPDKGSYRRLRGPSLRSVIISSIPIDIHLLFGIALLLYNDSLAIAPGRF